MIGRQRVFVSANKMADALGFRRKQAIAALGLSFLLEEEAQQPCKRSRKVYMRDWTALREERGIYHQLVKELEMGDRVAYKEFFRMTKQKFCFLVEKVSPLIEKKQQPSPINSRRTPRCYITLFSNWRKLSLTWVLVPHFATIDFVNRLWNKSCPLSSIGARISKSSQHGKRVADIRRQIPVQVEFSSWHWCNWRETGDHSATTQLGLPFLRLQRKQ